MEKATVRSDQSEGDSCWKQCSSSLADVCEENEKGGDEGGGEGKGNGEEGGAGGGEIHVNRSDTALRQEQVVFKDNREDAQEERIEKTIDCESLGRGDAQLQELDIGREHCDQERLDEKDNGEKEDGETMEADMCPAEGTGGCTSVTVYGYLCEEAPHLVARSSCCVFTKNRDNFFKGCKW